MSVKIWFLILVKYLRPLIPNQENDFEIGIFSLLNILNF